jgi:hypothetical protein
LNRELISGVRAEEAATSLFAMVHTKEPDCRLFRLQSTQKRVFFCASASKQKTNPFATEVIKVCKKKRGESSDFHPVSFNHFF